MLFAIIMRTLIRAKSLGSAAAGFERVTSSQSVDPKYEEMIERCWSLVRYVLNITIYSNCIKLVACQITSTSLYNFRVNDWNYSCREMSIRCSVKYPYISCRYSWAPSVWNCCESNSKQQRHNKYN